MTIAAIDPCSGATDFDATFLLDDSDEPMPMAVDPDTGFVYVLQTYTAASWSLYRIDTRTKVQSLVRRFNETGLERCRDLTFNPVGVGNDRQLIYGVQTATPNSASFLMAINKVTGEFAFRNQPIGQNGIYSLEFNSTGTLFGVKLSAAPTQVFTIDPVRFTSTMATSVPNSNNVQTVVSLPRSFSNCLQPFASTLSSGHVLLADNLGAMVRYSKTPGVCV